MVSDDFIKDYVLYEEGQKEPKIFNNLSSAAEFWEKELCAPKEVLEIVKEGFKIPFLVEPPKYEKGNNRSARDHAEFVDKAVQELIKGGLVEETFDKPWVVSPLSVAKGDKLRLILDLSVTNNYVAAEPFTLEDQFKFFEFAKTGNFVTKFDIKQCYHQIMVHPSFRKFLGFKWLIAGVEKYYVFKVLPFGLSCGPVICKKLFKPLVSKWRTKFIKIVLFFDDGILCAESYKRCYEQSMQVKSDLLRAHVVPNAEKSDWIPRTSTTWLGYYWNFEKRFVSVSAERVRKLFCRLFAFKRSYPICTARSIAGIVGSVVSMGLVLGDKGLFLCRFLQCLVNFRNLYEFPWAKIYDFSVVKGFARAQDEVEYLIENFETLNLRLFEENTPEFQIQIFGDAGESKIGGIFKENGKTFPFSQSLPPHLIGTSSTLRELYCVKHSMELFRDQLSNKCVLYITDSQCTEIIVRKGSVKFDLHCMAKEIMNASDNLNCTFKVAWVPRVFNSIADHYSKVTDNDDWTLTTALFEKISRASKLEFDLDCFASYKNRKCKMFYSRLYDKDTSGIDALNFCWRGYIVWVCPPPRIALKVLVHFWKSGAKGAFIVPKWTGQAYWALIHSDIFQKCMLHKWEFHGKKYIIPGDSGNNVFKNFKGILSVFVLDFSCEKS